MIVGISGKFRTGKDTVGTHLVNKYGFKQVSFAKKLKEVCADLFDMEGKNRALLQQVGEKMRLVDPEVWVKYTFRNVNPTDNVVVTDVRYVNEYTFLKNINGILIRTECDEAERLRRYEASHGRKPTYSEINHISETDLDGGFPKWDFIINSDMPIQVTLDMLDQFIEERLKQ